jgi:hypothetical protein
MVSQGGDVDVITLLLSAIDSLHPMSTMDMSQLDEDDAYIKDFKPLVM